MTQYRVASHTPKYLGFLGDFLDLHKGDKERFSYCGGDLEDERHPKNACKYCADFDDMNRPERPN